VAAVARIARTWFVIALSVGGAVACTHHHKFDNTVVKRGTTGTGSNTGSNTGTGTDTGTGTGTGSSTGTGTGSAAQAVDDVTATAQQLWAKRQDPVSAKAAVAAWQRVTVAHPDNAEAFERFAQANYFLATAFKTPDDEARALYSAAIIASERGLRIASVPFETARRKGIGVADTLNLVSAREASLLYWHAISLSAWAAKGGFIDQMNEMPNARKLMHWIDQNAPAYDGAGAARWLGAYYAAAPSIAGGDMKESRRFFDRAITLAPTRLDNHFVFAELYARSADDTNLWRAQLQLAASATLPSDALPEDRLTQAEAKRLLARGFAK